MTDVGVRELKQRLSEYLDRAERGELVRVTERGRPKALLGPLPGRARVEEGVGEVYNAWVGREPGRRAAVEGAPAGARGLGRGSGRLSLYVDSSALLKRYVDESDSETAESFLRSDPSLLTARHTIVEVRSNLARLLDKREAAAARSAFLEDLGVLSIVELDEVTCEMAAAIAEVTGARTLDVASRGSPARRRRGRSVPDFRSAPGASGACPGAHGGRRLIGRNPPALHGQTYQTRLM
jgi:uncharacterized protein